MIFRNDHDPPHFHVFGNTFSAKVSIADGTVLEVKGRLPMAERRIIVAWGHRHRAELYDNWLLARSGEAARTIGS